MKLEIKPRFLLFIALTLFSFVIAVVGVHPVVAKTTEITEILGNENPSYFEQQGKQLYTTNNFTEAIARWQQAAKIYAEQNNILGQARVITNLALAYQQIGDFAQAGANINHSLSLLHSQTAPQKTNAYLQVLAQTLNTQGILQLAQGEERQASMTWQNATEIYQQIGDRTGVIRASINLASALRNLGMYRYAYKVLNPVEQDLQQQPDSLLKAAALRSYGDILRLMGEFQQAQHVLTQSLLIAEKLDSPQEQVKTLFVLGNNWQANKNDRQALKYYQQAATICQQEPTCATGDLPRQVDLAIFKCFLDTENWQQAEKLLPTLRSSLTNLPPNRTNIYQQIIFAQCLITLQQKFPQEQFKQQKSISWQQIESILADTAQKAEITANKRAKAYILGLQGQIYEQQQQWLKAKKLTKQALLLAQTINAPEISYLWQWQLGRIGQAQGNSAQAIAFYTEAVNILQSISQDLTAINVDLQYSFRDSVEPVYRELVSLLLKSDSPDDVSQENLTQARDVIESLQLAELNNFFQEACLEAKPINIDKIDRQAAVIYPIILRDRLEVIVSIPQKPLIHYSIAITQPELEAVIEQFNQTIVIRSRRQFYSSAEKLYDWLIRPVLKDLQENNISTIILVPDGSLRNIPLAALYDGKQYLIEQYRLALNPGLQLLEPRSLEQREFKTLALGLTQPRETFPPLYYVDRELANIKEETTGKILLNEKFTLKALEKQIEFSRFPIIHIATHGQFSSTLDQTFLLAWDSRINISKLDRILRTRNISQTQAIELLVLSACETAAGDNRAALGLAGMAVRAGARSTVATLWAVNDRSTAQLMSKFYQELTRKNISKAEAIRQAQLSLLQTNKYKHPFYWAAYVLLGNWL
ncbi:MAG: CHAT domain-containing protein [Xenococcaceae cyanobacterium MO_188.B29]|nr:CHAT domain-containing protein [Xenococcaceae cyanobacterium MO_188.B29]